MWGWKNGRTRLPPSAHPLTALALVLAGYSICCALAIALAHFGGPQYREQPQSRAMGLLLLLALAGLQAAHFAALYAGTGVVDRLPYRMALFAVAPSFHLFSRPLLKPAVQGRARVPAWLHFVPMLVVPLAAPALAQPLAFVAGAGYLLWLGRSLLPLRQERARFRAEVALLGLTFVLAAGVAVLGFVPAGLPEQRFVALYAIAIGLAFGLVQATLMLRPQLSVEVTEAVQTAYAHTTLARVDCEAALARLQSLMAVDRLYTEAELSLPALAARLELSAHQLSELLNTRLGKSFARYLREQRVGAAKAMLLAEPAASVLSVGLSVGFTSQSNFYEAFREIEGTTPGQYRKLQKGARAGTSCS